MGVKNLWDILESCKKILPLHHLQNKRVCIDLSCWIIQLEKVYKSHLSMKERVYLRGLFHRLRALIALNCSIIFVSDGSIPAIKLSTYRRRLDSGNEVTQDEPNSHNATSLRRSMNSVFSRMISEAKILGTTLGIPCLDGIEEAEAQCALLNSESICDGCFTSDSDAFLFGARTVYRDICLGEGGHVVCYEMSDIESKLGLGRNSLITLALLLGGDYSQGVHGIGPVMACQIVKSIGDNIVLKRVASEGLSFAKNSRSSRKQWKALKCDNKENCSDHEMNISGEYNSNGENQFLQVINAYLKPKCHSADSDAVHRVLALYPFQRSKLQQICTQFFEWPPEKTDEYILPKIAERDLRRFANLRSASSDLGVRLPLHEMPVKCPISEIIKRRGKECFEVSWEDLDGLNSSVVQADLIDRACPEKIAEFEDKKAQDKKQRKRKPRPKKSENKAPVAEINQELQHLLLDIELGSNSVPKASASDNRTVLAEVGTSNYDLLQSQDSENNKHFSPSGSEKEILRSKCSENNNNFSASTHFDPSGSGKGMLLSQESEHNKNFSASTHFCLSGSGKEKLRSEDSENNNLFASTHFCPFGSGKEMLLSQDSENNNNFSATTHFYLPGSGKEVIDLLSPSPAIHTRYVSKFQHSNVQHVKEPENSINCYAFGSIVGGKEVIDLLTPSPAMPVRYVSKYQQANAKTIDIMDSSESESDRSPNMKGRQES